jgi:hypothetical protein
MNTIIVLLAGLVVGFLSLFIMNRVFPNINKFGINVYQYYTYQIMNGFSNTGYIHVWPPILAILIIFVNRHFVSVISYAAAPPGPFIPPWQPAQL